MLARVRTGLAYLVDQCSPHYTTQPLMVLCYAMARVLLMMSSYCQTAYESCHTEGAGGTCLSSSGAHLVWYRSHHAGDFNCQCRSNGGRSPQHCIQLWDLAALWCSGEENGSQVIVAGAL